MRVFAWVGRLFLMMMLTGQAFADTTFVSGAVSGEWTREGNPYIVVDSTWVPPNQRLVMKDGIRVFFSERQGLYVFGTLNVEGDGNYHLGDIRISVIEGVEDWMGLRFYGRGSSNWFFARIDCPDTAIFIDNGYRLNMSYVRIDAFRSIRGFQDDRIIRNCIIDFLKCNISGGMGITFSGGRVNASHTLISMGDGEPSEAAVWAGEGTVFNFFGCEVFGSLGGTTSIIDSCYFFRTSPNYERVSAGASGEGGSMRRTYVEGTSGGGVIRGDYVTPFENNIVMESCGFSGNARILNCEIGGDINHNGRHANKITIQNTSIGGLSLTDVDTVIIDSCIIDVSLPHLQQIYFRDVQFAFFTRNIIKSKVSLGSIRNYFDHNTIIFEAPSWDLIQGGAVWTNNIFIINQAGGQLRLGGEIDLQKYNCFWGFDEVWAGDDIEDHEPDATNIFANPIIEWFGPVPMLSAESPCIDQGDPSYAHDRDGTRSDIGAIYFHQESSIPLDQPLVSNFQLSAFPNPFNAMLTISFMVGALREAPLRLAIYDLSGREVFSAAAPLRVAESKTADHRGSAEENSVVWDASTIPAGVYLVRLEAGAEVVTKKVVLVR